MVRKGRPLRAGAPLVAAILLAFASVLSPARATPPVPVGVAWPDLGDARWSADEAAIRAAIEKAGGEYISADAKGSAALQAAQVRDLAAGGAKAVIIVSPDGDIVSAAARKAAEAGTAVIAYARMINAPGILSMAYDGAAAGRLMAKGLLTAKPAGAYAFIRGPKGDPNSDLINAAVMDELKPAIAAGKIKVAETAFVDGWKPDGAMDAMQALFGKSGGKIDAVVVESDAMAGGVAAALAAQGASAAIAVAGAGGGHEAANRIALGTETLSVWEDGPALGDAAGKAAVALGGGRKPSEIVGAKPIPGGKGEAVLLEPLAITRDNLGAVVDHGWMTKAQICNGASPKTTPFCG